MALFFTLLIPWLVIPHIQCVLLFAAELDPFHRTITITRSQNLPLFIWGSDYFSTYASFYTSTLNIISHSIVNIMRYFCTSLLSVFIFITLTMWMSLDNFIFIPFPCYLKIHLTAQNLKCLQQWQVSTEKTNLYFYLVSYSKFTLVTIISHLYIGGH